MKSYLVLNDQKEFHVVRCKGTTPHGVTVLIEVHDKAEGEDFIFDEDGDIIELPHRGARESDIPFYHEAIKIYSDLYKEIGMHPWVVKENGELKIVMLKVGERHSGALLMAPNGFKPGDEEFVKEFDGGLEFDFKGKQAALAKQFKSPEDLRKAEEWDNKSILGRAKKSFFGG